MRPEVSGCAGLAEPKLPGDTVAPEGEAAMWQQAGEVTPQDAGLVGAMCTWCPGGATCCTWGGGDAQVVPLGSSKSLTGAVAAIAC